MVTDPIGDFLVRIQNASSAGHNATAMPYSSLKEEIAKVLINEGYILSAEKKGEGVKAVLEIGIKYKENATPYINKARRVSKPSRRTYSSYKEIRPFKYGKGRSILSTPKGILTDVKAREEKVGGEILFTIW